MNDAYQAPDSASISGDEQKSLLQFIGGQGDVRHLLVFLGGIIAVAKQVNLAPVGHKSDAHYSG